MLTFSCASRCHSYFSFFFFNDTATTEIYTLSLHDALPILSAAQAATRRVPLKRQCTRQFTDKRRAALRSEEHTSELQSQSNLVCRLLLEKKKKTFPTPILSPSMIIVPSMTGAAHLPCQISV